MIGETVLIFWTQRQGGNGRGFSKECDDTQDEGGFAGIA
jgi:hypothetical protein